MSGDCDCPLPSGGPLSRLGHYAAQEEENASNALTLILHLRLPYPCPLRASQGSQHQTSRLEVQMIR